MSVELKPCPKCGCPDELGIDSNCDAEASWIDCAWCGHKMQARCDEETLAERWNSLPRGDMPAFDACSVIAEKERHGSPNAQLYRALEFWYREAKAAKSELAAERAAGGVDKAMPGLRRELFRIIRRGEGEPVCIEPNEAAAILRALSPRADSAGGA